MRSLRGGGRGLLIGAALAGLALLALAWLQPAAGLGAAGMVGYAVCHQIPERSFQLAGAPLPFCARCIGTFPGALIGFVALLARRRDRCRGLPPRPILAVLIGFLVVWGLDGLNSYLSLFPRLPHLYEPHNALRLVTGMLNGLALSHLVYPVFSAAVWVEARPQRSIENWRELGLLVVSAGALVGLILAGWGPALYVATLASALGVLTLLGIANGLIGLVALRREQKASRWADLTDVGLFAGALTLGEIAGLNLLRAWLTRTFGLPF